MKPKAAVRRFQLYRRAALTVAMIGASMLAGPVLQAQASDETEILAVIDEFMAAVADQDHAKLVGLGIEGYVAGSTRPGKDGGQLVRIHRVDSQPFPDEDLAMTERYWDPTVTSDGAIATVWAPYDFWYGADFSHCGVDVFTMLKVDGRWQIAAVIYTVVEDGRCESHPQGPHER